MWAGPSPGGECAICGAPVAHEEMEYELEYARSAPDSAVDTHHVHIRCFTAYIQRARGIWGDPSRKQA
jgi:hypothetical protein